MCDNIYDFFPKPFVATKRSFNCLYIHTLLKLHELYISPLAVFIDYSYCYATGAQPYTYGLKKSVMNASNTVITMMAKLQFLR